MSVRRFALLLFTLLALGSVSSASATLPGTNGRIAFTSNRDGGSEIYSIGQDGTSLRRLTTTVHIEQAPDWSPDGTKIAYERLLGGGDHWRIWVMNADGSAQIALTPESNYSDDMSPVWSPDGSRIAFAS